MCVLACWWPSAASLAVHNAVYTVCTSVTGHRMCCCCPWLQDGLSEWPTLGGNVSSELDWEVATAHDGGGNSSLGGNSTLLPPSPSPSAAAAIPVPAASAAAAPAAASPGRVGSLASSHGSGGGAAIAGRTLTPPPPQQLPAHLHPIATAAAAAATGNPSSAISTASGSVPLPPPAAAVLAASHNSPPGSPALRHGAATADGGAHSPSRAGSNALPPLPPAPGSAAGSMSAFRRVGSHSGSLAALLPQPAAAVAAIFDSAVAPSSPLAALLPGPAAAAVASMDSDADIARYNAAAAAVAMSAGGSRPGSAHGSIGGGVEGGVGSASGMQGRSSFRPVFGGDGDEEDEAMQVGERVNTHGHVRGDVLVPCEVGGLAVPRDVECGTCKGSRGCRWRRCGRRLQIIKGAWAPWHMHGSTAARGRRTASAFRVR